MRPVFFLMAIGLAGCGRAERIPDAVPIKCQVTRSSGQPVTNVLLTLQPLEAGHMAGLKVEADGQFAGEVVPGKYAYFFTAQESKNPAERQKLDAALLVVPEKYRSASMERTIAIGAGEELHIQLE